ncbi:hypothetical protein ACFLV1_00430 [Chloroflexota bacterium]
MKFLIGFSLIIGGLFGIVISLLGDTVVTSDLFAVNGMEISLAIGSFSLLALLGGLYTFFAN